MIYVWRLLGKFSHGQIPPVSFPRSNSPSVNYHLAKFPLVNYPPLNSHLVKFPNPKPNPTPNPNPDPGGNSPECNLPGGGGICPGGNSPGGNLTGGDMSGRIHRGGIDQGGIFRTPYLNIPCPIKYYVYHEIRRKNINWFLGNARVLNWYLNL